MFIAANFFYFVGVKKEPTMLGDLFSAVEFLNKNFEWFVQDICTLIMHLGKGRWLHLQRFQITINQNKVKGVFVFFPGWNLRADELRSIVVGGRDLQTLDVKSIHILF